jgi:exonuclease III
MRFGTWNVRSLHMSGSLTRVAKELTRCKLDLVNVQDVRWKQGALLSVGVLFFVMEKGTKIINCDQAFCTPQNSISS